MLDYSYFKDHYKIIVIDLSKHQALDADPRVIQQINFTANEEEAKEVKEAKETVLDFSQGTVKVLQFNFWLI